MISKISIFFFVTIGFIFPTVSFPLYTLLITLLILTQKNIKFHYKLNAVFIVFFLIISFFHFFINNYIEDLNESLRVVFVLILVLSAIKEDSYNNILLSIRLVSILLFITVLFQWIYAYSDFWSKFIGVLYSENHYEAGLKKIAPRAMGFMSNIIEAGFLFFISIIVTLNRLSKKQNKVDLFFLLISILGLLLTQSKTLIIIGLISIVTYLILHWKSNKLMILTILTGIFYFRMFILETFSQLERLKDDGIQTSSFDARKVLWKNVVESNLYNSNWFEKIFGIGRGGFAQIYGDITLDSDFFYILNQFGLFGILIAIIFISINLYFIINLKNLYYVLFFLLCIISSLFIDLFTNVKVIFMIFITSNLFKNESRIYLR